MGTCEGEPRAAFPTVSSAFLLRVGLAGSKKGGDPGVATGWGCCVQWCLSPSPCCLQGVKLLSYLYQEALDNCSNEHYPVLLSLLKTSCEPYTRFIHDWVYSGVFRDVYGEFMIQVNHEYLGFRGRWRLAAGLGLCTIRWVRPVAGRRPAV